MNEWTKTQIKEQTIKSKHEQTTDHERMNEWTKTETIKRISNECFELTNVPTKEQTY